MVENKQKLAALAGGRQTGVQATRPGQSGATPAVTRRSVVQLRTRQSRSTGSDQHRTTNTEKRIEMAVEGCT